MDKKDILSFTLKELEQELLLIGEKKFRASQIYEWLHKKRAVSFDEMTNLSVELRDKLNSEFYINRLKIVKKLESACDNTVKYLYELQDGNHLETVMMDYKHGISLCVSSQVGCKMGCSFCASTKAGFKRNLLPSEILGQLYESERDSGKKIGSIVMMGIGEPLDNYDNTLKFLEILSSEKGTNMSLRHVSVSTCGLVNRINDLAKLKLGITLSVSLHSTNDKDRSAIMPVNNTYNVKQLIDACKKYIDATGRRISFEYSVIEGVNNSKEQANELIALLRGINCHVNIIPVNKIKERNYTATRKAAYDFAEYLSGKGINATVRRTLGSDINAACGQLRREYEI